MTYQSLSRGTVVSADDSGKMQTLTIRDQFGDRATDVEHWQPAGISHVPMPPKDGQEAEVIIGYVDGHAEHPVVLASADRRTRPKGMKPGDFAVYDPRDNRRRVHFGEDGTLTIAMPSGGKAMLDIDGQKLGISKDGWDFQGSGFIKHNGKRIDAQHRHDNVQTGGGQTGLPVGALASLFATDIIVRLLTWGLSA